MAITPGVVLPLIGPVPTPGPSTSLAPPSVISVTPGQGFPGDIIVITGAGFTGTLDVEFGIISGGEFVSIASVGFFAVNGDNQITLALPSTGGIPTTFLQVIGRVGEPAPPGSTVPISVAGIAFNILVNVTWDATGCNLLAADQTFTKCPTISNFHGKNNVSVGVQIFNGRLTALSASGAVGQGAGVDPLFLKSSGFFYWEVTWIDITSDPIGIGITGISNLDNYSPSAVGGALIRSDSSIWVNGSQVQAAGIFPPPLIGSIVGVLAHLIPSGSGVNFLSYINGVQYFSSGFTLPADTGYVPYVVFDTASQGTVGVIANFGGRGSSSMYGPTNFASSYPFTDPSLILGWPGSIAS